MRGLLLITAVFVAAPGGGEIEGKAVKFVNGKAGFQGLEFVPPGDGPFPAVIVLHGDFGLTPWTRKQCSRLAGKGYHVLAIDLYRGQLPKDVEEAHILERGLEDGKVHAQVKLALDRLSRMKGVRKDAIAVLGFDMGGGYALDMALQDQRIKAAINCYGRLTTDARQLAGMSGSLLCLMAGKDEGIPQETIEQFRKALTKAGKAATIHVYPDAPTAFLDPDSPYHGGKADGKVIADAWGRIEAHLEKALK